MSDEVPPPGPSEPERPLAPVFYAGPRRLGPRARDWWLLLHPPYTLWHLSYVVIGACLAPEVDLARLGGTLLIFLLAVGVGAHALDELHGRPLGTSIPDRALVAAGVVGVGGAAALGVVGAIVVGPGVIGFIVVGVVLAVGYNLELFGGRLHTDITFAASWGAFPVLTASYLQSGRIGVAAAAAAAGAFFLSAAQRALSTPARTLRRRTSRVTGSVELADGAVVALDVGSLLAPLEGALRALTRATVALAAGLALARLTGWR